MFFSYRIKAQSRAATPDEQENGAAEHILPARAQSVFHYAQDFRFCGEIHDGDSLAFTLWERVELAIHHMLFSCSVGEAQNGRVE